MTKHVEQWPRQRVAQQQQQQEEEVLDGRHKFFFQPTTILQKNVTEATGRRLWKHFFFFININVRVTCISINSKSPEINDHISFQ
jgi:hypothetical protein